MKLLRELLDWVYSITIAFALALVINAFLFQPTRVQGSSMEPTLENNNYLFVSKISHTLGQLPDYSDIVIIDSRVLRERSWKDDISDPLNTYLAVTKVINDSDHHIWVKRVIGKPGDTLEFKDGKVYRNGTALDEPYVKEAMQYASAQKIVVPENKVFVMGDNRNNSKDSRYIGPVPANHVLGRVVLKI
ncbi:MAG TPA: signal peptidase I [Methylomusa anaerophila]|uniref:Signal peptidase I n=1 Tax=Methylomusa anaerophila TaxID=1930071 RepID=A0A348ALC6_9FIRM|nr:signal peptidase I [Methylomusa anaerophila]BBB91874.1 signal peptidase I T [Methylomusa anaerophila]HML88395.1 signal peptidase I [Methylomusa anaerophila]